MFEILVEIFVYLIFGFPGAFIRWIFKFRKHSFWEVYNTDSYTNGFIGFISFILILTIYVIAKQL